MQSQNKKDLLLKALEDGEKLKHFKTFIIADTDAVDLVAEVLSLDLRVSHHLKVDKLQCFCHY